MTHAPCTPRPTHSGCTRSPRLPRGKRIQRRTILLSPGLLKFSLILCLLICCGHQNHSRGLFRSIRTHDPLRAAITKTRSGVTLSPDVPLCEPSLPHCQRSASHFPPKEEGFQRLPCSAHPACPPHRAVLLLQEAPPRHFPGSELPHQSHPDSSQMKQNPQKCMDASQVLENKDHAAHLCVVCRGAGMEFRKPQS